MLTIDDRGQATVEYALAMIVAGTLALAAIAWAVHSHALSDLFDHVLHSLTSKL